MYRRGLWFAPLMLCYLYNVMGVRDVRSLPAARKPVRPDWEQWVLSPQPEWTCL